MFEFRSDTKLIISYIISLIGSTIGITTEPILASMCQARGQYTIV